MLFTKKILISCENKCFGAGISVFVDLWLLSVMFAVFLCRSFGSVKALLSLEDNKINGAGSSTRSCVVTLVSSSLHAGRHGDTMLVFSRNAVVIRSWWSFTLAGLEFDTNDPAHHCIQE